MIWIVAFAYALMAYLLLGTWRYRRFLLRSREPATGYAPKAALLVPIRGLDPGLSDHLDRLFELDYPDYEVVFGVADLADEARPLLERACRLHGGRARLVVAGTSLECSSKLHNLLQCQAAVSPDVEVLAVVDGDVQVHRGLLRALVAPLADPFVGATTGYRWLVAEEPTLARTVANLTNAAGAVSFWLSNNVWGGAMAMRRRTFEALGVARVWNRVVSDDLTLRSLVRRNGMRVESVPAALLVSQQEYDWRSYWEFLVRQLVIARVYAPLLWWQVVALYVVTSGAMLCGAAGGLSRLLGGHAGLPLAALPLCGLYVLQGWLAVGGGETALRRRGEAFPVLPRAGLVLYPLAVLVGCAQVLASAARRQICWRGIVYRMPSRHRTEVILPAALDPACGAPQAD